MRVEIVNPCRDPEPAGWEDFRRAQGLPAIWAYDVIGASCAGSWASPLLAVFRDGGRIAGIAGAVCVGPRWPGSNRTPRPRREPIILDVRLPAHSNGPTWHFSAEAGPEARRSALRRFERAARRELGFGMLGVTYRMVTGPELPLVARRGALVREVPGSTVMDLRWSSVDGWLGSLSRNRRKNLRRMSRSLARDGDLLVTEGTARRDLDPAEMAEMNRRHTERLAARFEPRAPLPAGYFAALLGRADVSIISYHAGGRLLAFAIIFDHGTAPISGPWAALRPEEGGRAGLYFEVHPRIVRHAIAGGGERLLSGRGRVDLKRTLGFDPVPMSFVAVPRWVIG